MKKISFIIGFLIIFVFCAYAENTRKVTATHYYEDNPKKEMTFYNASNKEIAKEYYHIDGSVMGVKGQIPDGQIFEYFLSGDVKSKAVYKSNHLVSEVEYFENGIKKSETVNKWEGRVLLNSKSIYYYENGKKHQEVTMDGNGDGTSKVYYETGELFEDAKLKGAYREGPVTRYYKNGKPMLKGFMKDDMLDGSATEYNSSGQIKRKVKYKEDEEIK